MAEQYSAKRPKVGFGSDVPAHQSMQVPKPRSYKPSGKPAPKHEALQQLHIMQHLSYSCPGLSGPGADTRITPLSFAQLLSPIEAAEDPDNWEHKLVVGLDPNPAPLHRSRPLVIPLFQRKYCWEDSQGHKWWEDVNSAKKTTGVDGKHTTGKIVTKMMNIEYAGRDVKTSNATGERTGKKDNDHHNIESIIDDNGRGVARLPGQDRGENCIYIIDGQQRITTTCLLLAALRDAALFTLLLGNESVLGAEERKVSEKVRLDEGGSSDRRSSLNPEHKEEKVEQLVDHIHAYLFSDPASVVVWCQHQAEILHQSLLDISDAVEEEQHQMLMRLVVQKHFCETGNVAASFFRLVPSYDDRLPFADTMLSGLLVHSLLKRLLMTVKLSNNQPTNEEEKKRQNLASKLFFFLLRKGVDGNALLWSEGTHLSHMGRMKILFDRHIAAATEKLAPHTTTVFQQAVPGHQRNEEEGKKVQESIPVSPASLMTDCCFLTAVTKLLLHDCYVINIDVRSEVNLSQVFLWLQEKSLFGMGALLYNAAPGVKFSATDLIRNLLLAPMVMSEGLSKQEHFHRQYWLQPIEQKVGASVIQFEQFLRSFLSSLGDRVAPIPLSKVRKEEMIEKQQRQQHDDPSPSSTNDDAEMAFVPPALMAAAKAAKEQEAINATVKRHISAFENQVMIQSAGVVASGMPPASEGIFLYARFVSFFEQVAMECADEMKVERKQSEDDDDDRDAAKKETVTGRTIMSVLNTLARYAAAESRQT